MLSGKVAIVTGAGSPRGTGHAMVEGLVKAGARVAMVDISSEWLAQSVAEVRRVGGADCAIGIRADVSDQPAVERAVSTTLESLGGLHILINNAGTNPRSAGFAYPTKRFWDLPVEAFDRVVSVNLNAAFYAIRACVNHMLAQRFGRIVGVTTSLDTMYGPGKIPYGPSKAGHEALVAAMASELEDSGVTANILVPGGPCNTNFFTSTKTDAQRAAMIQPEVMGPPAVWLGSDASHAFNGQRIIACRWDETLAIAERLARASAPAAWPQLGQQAVMPRKDLAPA